MKKVMIIGKFNEITKQINDTLSPQCRVQLCAAQEEIAEGMLRLVAPDLVIVSLVGTRSAHAEIFSLLYRETYGIPIIAVGTTANQTELEKLSLLRSKRLHFLCRPIKLEAITSCAKELLNLGEPDDAGMKTILVVDDNPTILRTMQSMLAEKYKVTFATSGTQAIAAVGKSRPDLILLDYDMPVCDGRMTLQLLRSEPDTRDIPVVFLTGIADSEHVQEVLSLRPQGYLLKPPSREKIFETLEDILSPQDGKGKKPPKR